MAQLRDGTTHQGAVTSMEPNADTFILHSETSKVLNLYARELELFACDLFYLAL